MPIRTNAYLLAEDDILNIEGVKINENDIVAYSIVYNQQAINPNNFHYVFEMIFSGQEGIDKFKIIRNELQLGEKILWYNNLHKETVSLTIEDAIVEYNDEEMEKLQQQHLKIVTYDIDGKTG